MTFLIAALSLLFVGAQDTAQQDRLLKAVRAAMAAGLQSFPDSEPDGALPTGGNTEALWMVRPVQPGDSAIELLANPLNEVNQLKAARAMAQIERNIQAAQRRAAAQYERAVAEAKRTGKSQEVDGVTLADEGVDGARIDAESRVVVDVAFNQPAYRFTIAGDAQPVLSTLQSGAVTMISFSSSVYRDESVNADRYSEAEAFVFLGRLATPQVSSRGDHAYEVTAFSTPADRAGLNTLVLRYRGNETLIKDLLSKTAWNLLLELLR